MNYKNVKIKEGISMHIINTDKFKTNLMAVFLTTKLTRENVTKNALIPMVLRQGSVGMRTQEEISKQMEELYGTIFDSGLDKTGDNQVIKLYMETINDKYIPKPSNKMIQTLVEKLLEISFKPYVEDGGFSEKYVEQEKNTLRKIIESKIDNKARYAQEKCIEEMYKNEPFGLYKFGYVEDLDKINAKNLYEYYKELLNTCKIDIFLSGDVDENAENIISNNENIVKLQSRKPNYNVPIIVKKNAEEKIVTESMDISQGKLVLGLDIDINNNDEKYEVLMFNTMLGGSANSKLFQNVREKAHLAYVASSNYYRFKNNIIINCGIEIANFEKTLKIVKQQLEDFKNGKFSEEDLQDCKKIVEETVNAIEDEQDTGITYWFSQELADTHVGPKEYIEKVNKINKNDIIKIAKKVKVNTIYFLKN